MRLSPADIDLLLRRRGTAYWIAGLLILVAAAVHVMWVIPLESRAMQRQAEHARIVAARAVAAPASARERSLDEERLAAFVGTLGERAELSKLIGVVFAQAERHGLILVQADYKLDDDKAGEFHTYQMTVPVRGQYSKLRGLVDAILEQVPCAALDDIDFKRDAAGTAQTEARLRFVFFLRDSRS